MAVKVPTPDEIRKLLEEKKRKASGVAQALDKAAEEAAKLDVVVHQKDGELRELRVALEALNIENAKLRDQRKSSVGAMRGKFDELIKKHACEPADELLRMCTERVPVLNADGSPAVDEEGRPLMRFALAPELRTNVLLKLMEFRMPKLRSTETSGQTDINMRVVVVRFGESTPPPEAIDV